MKKEELSSMYHIVKDKPLVDHYGSSEQPYRPMLYQVYDWVGVKQFTGTLPECVAYLQLLKWEVDIKND